MHLNSVIYIDVLNRDRNDLLDLCDRLLDMNPEMRPTTQKVLFELCFKQRFFYILF